MSRPSSPIYLRILVACLISLLFINADDLKSIETNIRNCSDYDCGNGVKITYPFWVSDPTIESSSYCGYQDFMVTCNASSPSFRTYSDNYTVKAIDTTTHILSLIDTNVIGASCPRVRHSVNISAISELSFAPSIVYLYFFFDCNLPVGITFPDEYHATCLKDQAGDSYVFIGPPNPQNDTLLSRFCSGNITSPVMSGQLNEASLATTFGKATNGGFDLAWRSPTMENCIDCEKSGGHCGYTNQSGDGFLFQCYCRDGLYINGDCYGSGKLLSTKTKIGIAIGGALVVFTFLVFCLLKFPGWSIFENSYNDQTVEALIESNGPLPLKRYNYSELKRVTASFNSKLGQGGYGSVYKGELRDGTQVAVKLLDGTKGYGDDFINEVASIGRTNHINVVSLLGFCSQGAKKALIYEYMSNGSLEKFLCADDPKATAQLGWDQRRNIAIGIAKGLEYIHRGCKTRMVHFDIKPHNILLDEDLCPKISDFGLAKLYTHKESILSTIGARGTIGYIAPEVFSRNFGVVSSKADVYSYGMVLLEIVRGRRNVDGGHPDASDVYFPHWIYEHLDQDEALQACGVTSGNEELARKMILVGLWCIQTNPNSRPFISKVVEMLEGNVGNLEIPPKPYLCSPDKSTNNSNVDSFTVSS